MFSDFPTHVLGNDLVHHPIQTTIEFQATLMHRKKFQQYSPKWFLFKNGDESHGIQSVKKLTQTKKNQIDNPCPFQNLHVLGIFEGQDS